MLNNDEICGDQHDTVYGIYMHLALGVLFYVTIKALKELLKLPLFAYETIVDRQYGLANTSCLGFFKTHMIDLFVKLFREGPFLVLAAALLILTKEFFFLIIIAGVALYLVFEIFIFPRFCECYRSAKNPLPEENDALRNKIEDLCAKLNFPFEQIWLVEDLTGDLHSNAYLLAN